MVKPVIGGQALIEGVMMKGPSKIAAAVRKKGKIIVTTRPYRSFVDRFPFLKLPLLRGIVFLIEMNVIGLQALTWSANQQGSGEELSTKELVFTLFISFAFAIGLFIILPYFATKLFAEKGLVFNLIDGLIRFVVFIFYLGAMHLIHDVRRTFQYHGAEHKVVNCFESGLKLTVNNAKKCSRIHPRCGTSLIVIVIGISILLFSLIQSGSWLVNIGARILFIPLIGGIAYELLKFGALHQGNLFVRLLIKPGLWTQHLTTREPSPGMLEVAIVALKRAQ